jgi:hypothetical protein
VMLINLSIANKMFSEVQDDNDAFFLWEESMKNI